jgi:hypothetical protein
MGFRAAIDAMVRDCPEAFAPSLTAASPSRYCCDLHCTLPAQFVSWPTDTDEPAWGTIQDWCPLHVPREEDGYVVRRLEAPRETRR